MGISSDKAHGDHVRAIPRGVLGESTIFVNGTQLRDTDRHHDVKRGYACTIEYCR